MTNIIDPAKDTNPTKDSKQDARKDSKKNLRQSIAQQRSRLTETQLTNCAIELNNIAKATSTFYQKLSSAKTIISYVAFDGEISPQVLTNNLKAQIYLPKILDYRNSKMAFYSSEENQIKNRYGIYEPAGRDDSIQLEKADIIFVPLVGFDIEGNRLGMGAGFYDRAISKANKRPLLVGLAHAFQQQQSIPTDTWDVTLDVILTNQKIINVTTAFHC